MPLLEILSAGNVYTIVQNQVYALPDAEAFIIADAVFEFSLQVGSGFAAVAASTTGFSSAWPYCRCTTAAARISVKRD